jgi:hypothetical protein
MSWPSAPFAELPWTKNDCLLRQLWIPVAVYYLRFNTSSSLALNVSEQVSFGFYLRRKTPLRSRSTCSLSKDQAAIAEVPSSVACRQRRKVAVCRGRVGCAWSISDVVTQSRLQLFYTEYVWNRLSRLQTLWKCIRDVSLIDVDMRERRGGGHER